jgi:hypothetical protein
MTRRGDVVDSDALGFNLKFNHDVSARAQADGPWKVRHDKWVHFVARVHDEAPTQSQWRVGQS